MVCSLIYFVKPFDSNAWFMDLLKQHFGVSERCKGFAAKTRFGHCKSNVMVTC